MSTVIGKENKPELHVSPDVLMGRKQRVEGMVYREARVAEGIEDEENRLVRVSFSSEEPYLRRSWWEEPWIEVLGHKPDEVDLSRMQNRATVHYNHSRRREDRLGAVLEAGLDGTKSTALLQFSDREDIDDIWKDIRKGLLCNVSVGYEILERVLMKQNDDGPDEYRVTLWRPMEVSIVDIPADPTVGVGRSDGVEHLYRVLDLEPAPAEPGDENEDRTVTDKDTKTKPAADTVTKTVAEALAEKAAVKAANKATKDAHEAAALRITEITEIFAVPAANEATRALLVTCISDPDCTAELASKALLEELGKNKTPTASGHFQPGDDAADKFRDAALNRLHSRARMKGDDGKVIAVDPASDVRNFSLPELARACLAFNNLDTSGSRLDMIGRALTMRSLGIGHTPSDFAQILLNTASKAALLGFTETPETWSRWCRVGSLSDFKQATRVGLSQFEDLELINPGGEYTYGTMSDKGETIQLGKYGKIFGIARETIINDDLSMLLDAPTKMGRAAARVPGDLAYVALTANPLLADGVALFAAGHNNLGTGGVISVASVGEARELMALQSDIGNNANGLNIQLGFLLVPVQLEDVANVLRTSEFDPDSATQSRAPNPRRNTFEVVGEARLSADDAAQWYGVAGAGNDTVEVAFLDGVQEPRIEEKQGWTVDGAEFKVAIECAAAPMEHRTFVRNAGA